MSPSDAVRVLWAYCPGCRAGNHPAHQPEWSDDDRRVPCPCGCAGGPAPRRRLDLDEIRAELGYAGSGIDGPDMPYHPHALAAMRAAEALLAEVERHRAQLAGVDEVYNLHTDSPAGFCPSCYRQADVSDTDDGLVAWPCPTLRALGVRPQEHRQGGLDAGSGVAR